MTERTSGELADALEQLSRGATHLLGSRCKILDEAAQRLREMDGERIEGPLMGDKHIIGRVRDITVRVEPTHEQCLKINDMWDGPVAGRRALLILLGEQGET